MANAAMWGFGATLGADAANAVVGEAKVCSSLFIALRKIGKRRDGEEADVVELGLKRHWGSGMETGRGRCGFSWEMVAGYGLLTVYRNGGGIRTFDLMLVISGVRWRCEVEL